MCFRLAARHGELADDHKAIGSARHDCRIVCAKPINRSEAARSQVEVDFVSQPAAHDERVVVRAFLLTISVAPARVPGLVAFCIGRVASGRVGGLREIRYNMGSSLEEEGQWRSWERA